MSSSQEKPPVPPGPSRPSGRAERSSEHRLFTNLIASKPPRDRRFAPWVIAALIHVLAIAVLLFTDVGHSVRDVMIEVVRPILLTEDNPPPIAVPVPPPAPAPQPRVEEEKLPPGTPTRPLTTPVAPGIPDPAGITVPPPAEPPPVVGGAGDAPRSLRDLLSPRAPPDPRLFGPTDGLPPPVGVEAARARLADRVREVNDSIMAELVAAENATDWTVKDKDGKRWGVSPGKLHLGDITLPLPIAFAPPAGRRDEINSLVRSHAEIEQQARRAEIKDNFNDRVKAIRKRKDAERAAALKKKTVTN